ncbi:MAG: hypothetical protein IJT41_11275 [Clostridia bacterium]|nr:hypothetical protein [Clostridia bacterium]
MALVQRMQSYPTEFREKLFYSQAFVQPMPLLLTTFLINRKTAQRNAGSRSLYRIKGHYENRL